LGPRANSHVVLSKSGLTHLPGINPSHPAESELVWLIYDAL